MERLSGNINKIKHVLTGCCVLSVAGTASGRRSDTALKSCCNIYSQIAVGPRLILATPAHRWPAYQCINPELCCLLHRQRAPSHMSLPAGVVLPADSLQLLSPMDAVAGWAAFQAVLVAI